MRKTLYQNKKKHMRHVTKRKYLGNDGHISI